MKQVKDEITKPIKNIKPIIASYCSDHYKIYYYPNRIGTYFKPSSIFLEHFIGTIMFLFRHEKDFRIFRIATQIADMTYTSWIKPFLIINDENEYDKFKKWVRHKNDSIRNNFLKKTNEKMSK